MNSHGLTRAYVENGGVWRRGEKEAVEPRLAFTLKLSVKIPATGLRGILDEAVTPCDDWDAGDTPDNREWCLVVVSSSISYKYTSPGE